MDQATRTLLKETGMDVDDTLARFGGNEALLMKYVRRFPADPSFAALEQALQSGDHEATQTACHTLKGVSGTLGLQSLYVACAELMADLRTRNQAAPMPARVQSVKAAYQQALKTVAALGDANT